MSATNVPAERFAAPVRLAVGARRRLTLAAWGSITAVVLFVGITLWWLSKDSSIPIFDAGVRLSQAIVVYEHLRSGSVGAALTTTTPYPPFAYLVGALGLGIGGLGVAPPIIAQNLIFVPLLALGCYNIGRLAFGPHAGLPAVAFALGSPLLVAQFHVFMIDAPETALVAVAMWLILASERFSRIWVSAAAGVVVGLGMLTKEPFIFFIAGLVLVTLLRGGWRAWPGLVAFALAVLVIAMPWYVSEFARVHELAQGVTSGNAGSVSSAAPPRWSTTNLTWYFSNIFNQQLYAPLFGFAAVGGLWMIVGLARRRPISALSWELLVGAFVGWLGITATFPHDTRYSMPLLAYLAVFASGWIVRLSRRWRLMATAGLLSIATANIFAASSGLGGVLSIGLPRVTSDLLKIPATATIYSNAGFLVSAPHRDGDVLGLMRALRHNGVRELRWLNLGPEEAPPGFTPDFSEAGLNALAFIVKLDVPEEFPAADKLTARYATLGHGPIKHGKSPPCTTLSDGTGVWVRLGNPNGPNAKNYCPFRHPPFY